MARPLALALALSAACAVAVAAAACGSSKRAAGSCARSARVELKQVEEGSEYMKRLFAHVGSVGRDEVPSDPAAIAAGVAARIDFWRHDELTDDGIPRGGKTYSDYYLTGGDRAALERYVATLEKPPAGFELRYEHVVPPPDVSRPEPHWRTYYLRSETLLDEKEFAEVRAMEANETYPRWRQTLWVELTDRGKARFAEITAASTGKKLATLVDATVVSAPIVNGPIRGGRFSITAGTDAAADEMLRRLACKP